MFDDFDFYMKKWTNAPKHAILREGLAVLDLYGETGTIAAITLRLEDSSSFSADENVGMVEETILDGLKGVFLAMNINLEGNVRDLSLILRGFHTLTTTEEHEYVITTLDVGGEPFEVINQLLEYADINASIAWQHCVNVYTNIPDGFLVRLRAVHEQAVANEATELVPPTTEQQTRFARIRFFFSKHLDSLAVKAIREDGVTVGLPIKTLINLYRKELTGLDTTQPLVLASSLLGLVMISDTSLDRISTVAKEMVDEVWAEHETIDAVDKALESMLLDTTRTA